MSLDQTVIRRLAFIKYLCGVAVTQSKEPAPLCCASILTLHDAVELFLQLSSEFLDAGGSKLSFMDYWEILNKKLHPEQLGQKESMRRLNNARVSLKHHGTYPSELDIDAFRSSTTAFFQDNTKLVFRVSIDEVSLIEYVNPESARQLLWEAQSNITEGDFKGAITKSYLAFQEILSDYETRKKLGSKSPFDYTHEFRWIDSHRMNFTGFGHSRLVYDLRKFIEETKKSFQLMQEVINIIGLGIDYRRYTHFKMLIPSILKFGDSRLEIRWSQFERSIEDAKFCFDFVIESTLKLAEYDYTVL